MAFHSSDMNIDSYLPVTISGPLPDFAHWKRRFRNKIADLVDAGEHAVARAKIQKPTATDPELAPLKFSEKQKIRALFNCLGSEGFRQFCNKATDWDLDDMGTKTLTNALEVCDQIFITERHPVVYRMELLRRKRKRGETGEQLCAEMREIAKYCRLGDREDERIMEAILFNYSLSKEDDKVMEKVVSEYPEVPTLAQVMQVINQFEATQRTCKAAKAGIHISEGAFAVRIDSSEGTSEEADDSDVAESSGKLMVLYKQKKGTGKNRNYVMKPFVGKKPKKQPGASGTSSKTHSDAKRCFGCGRDADHKFGTEECIAFGKKCGRCGKKNHFRRMCMQPQSEEDSSSFVRTVIRAVDAGDGNTTRRAASEVRPKIPCELQVKPSESGPVGRGLQPVKMVEFQGDCGAEVTTLRIGDFKRLWPTVKISPCHKILEGYDGSQGAALGRVKLEASFQGGVGRQLTAYLVEDKCQNLLGLLEMGDFGMNLDCVTKTAYGLRSEPAQSPEFLPPQPMVRS